MRSYFPRWLLVLALLPFSGSLLGCIPYIRWTAATRVALERDSQVVQTAVGPVEVALHGDPSRPALLVSHGTPGGYDQGLATAALFRSAEFRVVAPSRPGYLRTPLETGRTPQQQADAFAALLDALGLDRAIVVGLSGGGPAALHFALRHPQRCIALVMLSAVTETLVQEPHVLDSLLSSDFGAWMLTRFPSAAINELEKDPTNRERVAKAFESTPELARLIDSAAPATPRMKGVKNDDEQFRHLSPIPAEQLTCPTLIFHGAKDSLVPVAHADRLKSGFPQARLIRHETGGHFIFVGYAEELTSGLLQLAPR